MIKVMGTQRKSGNFKDPDSGAMIDYDNVFLFTTDDSQDGFDGINGIVCGEVKIKADQFSNMFGNKLDPDNAVSLIGNNIEYVNAMRNGKSKLVGIRIVK